MNDNSYLKNWLGLLFVGMGCSSVMAQNHQQTIRQFLQTQVPQQELSSTDLADWVITDEYLSPHSGITHVYIRQRWNGIEISNGVANFALNKEGKVISMGNRLVQDLAKKANAATPALTPDKAIRAAAAALGLDIKDNLQALEAASTTEFYYTKAGISKKEIPVRLVYWQTREGELRLAWDLSIYTIDAMHWWSVRVDAMNGTLLHKNDWVTHCNFGNCAHHTTHSKPIPTLPSPQITTLQPDQYTVYPLPVESPNHGARSLVVNPANATASPFGWHDTDGIAGAEYQITQGNNVYASEDTDDDDIPGYSPNGGGTLDFNFPLNLNQAPANYQDAAITNLFYMNNMLHDILHVNGFDEQAGNFQANNYGNGGLANDFVYADAQDGGGTDNANFATPPDGDNPRMQMYLWTSTGTSATTVDVGAPATIAGSYGAAAATIGGALSSPITAQFVLAVDATPDVNDACTPLTNSLTGKIAVIIRGGCNFGIKMEEAENAGAIAAIVINNQAGAPFAMGGSTNANIPAVMISQTDGAAILAQLNGGATVTGTLNPGASGNFDLDGDFDNGIIAHEYGHGLSTRLTGGPSNSDCLWGDEQMGEGWSDWLATILTMQPGHTATTNRPMGTYAIGEPISGIGIREAPYTTDMGVNAYTYDATNDPNLSVPHGVGFVWATMLWDLTWAFIDQYGYDADVYNGTGGNNMAMRLVIEGMKLQPCDPGFVDGRDAILLADQNMYGGANQCMIWEVFARRGLGYSADQGSSMDRSDQTEAFDLPTICMTPTVAPTANFSFLVTSTCGGTVNFTDNSTDIPQQWQWAFGDGNTSTQQNPTYTYPASGTYTVTLTASNTIGSDVITQTVSVQYPPVPTAADVTICPNNSATLTANATGDVNWYDANGLVYTGSTYNTPTLNTTTTYEMENVLASPSQFSAPHDPSFGTGSYHTGSTFTGTVNFTAYQPLTIVSAWVDASGAGDRTLYLWDDVSGNGNVVDQITVNIPNGQSRVQLDFDVPAPGIYSIGGSGVDLYRNNNGGTTYPYTIAGLISLTGSSAGTDFYYYLYDLEVQAAPCVSPKAPVTVNVATADFTYTTVSTNTIQFMDASAAASGWEWNFGDGNTSTQQNPSHVYANAGIYTVTLTINGSCMVSYPVTVGIVSVIPIADWTASLAPNPAQMEAVLRLSQPLLQDMQIDIAGTDGRLIETYILNAGKTEYMLDLQRLPSAIYFVRLHTTAGVQTYKLAVIR